MGEIHMGELLERAIRRTGLNITDIAVALGTSRRTVYNWFESESIDESIMERIAHIISHNSSSTGKSSVSIISREAIESLPLKDDAYWKDKYIDLLERYSELIAKNKTM